MPDLRIQRRLRTRLNDKEVLLVLGNLANPGEEKSSNGVLQYKGVCESTSFGNDDILHPRLLPVDSGLWMGCWSPLPMQHWQTQTYGMK